MTTTATTERELVIEKTETEVCRWSGYVDTLLRAFDGADDPPPALGYKLEALRHKRDSVLTKVEALKRHRVKGWARAREELDQARSDLRKSWRSVISTLDKESLFA